MVSYKQKGFTLLEVIIVLAIIAALTVGAISSYRGFDQIKRLEADSEAFIEGLELAKKQASSGQKPCVDYEGQYSVTWTSDQFVVTPVGCSSIQTYRFKGNTIDTGTASVAFNSLGRGTSLSTDLCVLIRNVYHDQCQKITIETSGTASSESNANCACD